MTDPVLGHDELENGQSQPEVTVNAATRKIAAAVGGQITIDFASDANRTLVADNADPENDEFPFGTIVMTDTGVVLTTGRDVIYPDVDTEYTGPSRLMFVFVNSTAQTLTVLRSGQTGVAVSAGTEALLYHNGADIVAIINPLP